MGGERTYHLRRRYGITAEEADAMLAEQEGLCANGSLGQFRDDPYVLQMAAFYVKHHAQRQGIARLVAASAGDLAGEPEADSRPGEPPVGSQRRPDGPCTSTRSTGRTSGARRRERAGEADG